MTMIAINIKNIDNNEMLKITCNGSKIELNRDEAIKLELKLNLTKPQQQNYIKIGDVLYEYGIQSLSDRTHEVTRDEFEYLYGLNKIDYEAVRSNPRAY